MKRSGNKTSRGTKHSISPAYVVLQERRIATPSPDLVVVRTGKFHKTVKVHASEHASSILARVAKVMSRPGADRAGIFTSTSGKPVFAYSVYSKDPTKIVREDASGRQTVGRIVGGRFRSVVAADTD